VTTPFLSVIVPAYNEETRLEKSLPRLRDFLAAQTYTWEVVLVDDGSLDRTAEAAARFFPDPERLRVVRNGVNRGKGYSVRAGARAARGDTLLLSDADLSTPMTELPKLLSCLQNGYDVVIGSRSLPESNVVTHQAWYREGMGRMFNKIVQAVALDGFIDTQCGFKCFRKKDIAPVFARMRIDRFSFDVELLFIARKSGLRIKEVPVEWHNVPHSRVRIVRDSANMLFDLFRIRWNDLTGKYK
jgi:dolichyl-phosphate beta-glucosyltransferase